MVTPKGEMASSAVSYHGTVNVLQAAVADCGPFDRAEWFALLAEAGQEPLVAQAGDVSLMLTLANGRIEPLRNWYAFTWRPHGDNPVLLAAIAQALRSRAHRVTLWPVPDEDGSATRLSQAFRTAGWRVSVEHCDRNHVLAVSGRSFAEYWAGRPGPMRTTLKRKAKKVSVSIHDRFDTAAWADYESIYAESWKPEEGDPVLLRRFAEAEGATGRIRLGVAHAPDGEPVAAQFWTVENGTAYIHKLAHRESARPLSAGTTLSAALFERVIDRDRVDLIDFGTGDDAYKRDWMEIDRPRYRIDCLDPRQPRAWPALAKRMLARAMRGR
ncbi:GNAT family N-acetyltransferase [Tsuneonella sp. YG55]|uniref:GNAT family N-acetyltransferase n=1 Tax=Tsuneonella litorea TaxID=2976475 RepID=A0A9X2W0R0_9SPHN|nr:GNAT family N-acetyltransferase [Tsuneonella litorea]MCT2558758.1 GNAT family N-acetyltransferase [Tsuneonella litorea]